MQRQVNNLNKTKTNPSDELITHGSVIWFLRALGYPVRKNGLCDGILEMWLQSALILDGLAKHYSKVKKLKDWQELLPEIQYALAKKGINLTEKDKDNINLKIFAEDIYLYQYDYLQKHKATFGGEKDYAKKLLMPDQLSQAGGCVNVHSLPWIYSKRELKKRLKTFIRIFTEAKQANADEMAIIIESIDHYIGIKYDVANNQWWYCDANALSLTTVKPSRLHKRIFESFYWQGEEFQALTLHLKTTANNPHIPILKKELMRLSGNNVVTEEILQRKTKENRTLLHHVACQGFVQFIHDAAKLNANIDPLDHKHKTPLLFAAIRGQEETTEALLKYDTNENHTEHKNRNALHLAAGAGHMSIVRLLAAHDVDIHAKDIKGRTPANTAKRNKYLDIEKYLHTLQSKIRKIEPLSVYQLYQYVFTDRASLNLPKVPQQYRDIKSAQKKAAIQKTFRPIIKRHGQAFHAALISYGAKGLCSILFDNHRKNSLPDIKSITDNQSFSQFTKYYFTNWTDQDIKKQFDLLDRDYLYFEDEINKGDIYKKYAVLFKAFILWGNFNMNRIGKMYGWELLNIIDYADFAYRILVVFGDAPLSNPLKNLENYQIKNGLKLLDLTLICSALYFDYKLGTTRPFPKKISKMQLSIWRKIIMNSPLKALLLFEFADKITLNSNDELPQLTLHVNNTRYRRHAENEELAKECESFTLPEFYFNRCLAINKRAKKKDNMPDVVINGANHGHPGYFFVKLSHKDTKIFMIGAYTGSCNWIANQDNFIEDAIVSPNVCYYVLLKGNPSESSPFYDKDKIDHKKFKIVGHALAYQDGTTLVVDSWEDANDHKRKPIVPKLLNAFAQVVTDKKTNFTRVIIGLGIAAHVPEVYKNAIILDPVIPHHTMSDYYDSNMQALIYQNEMKLKKVRRELEETCALLTAKYPDIFTNPYVAQLVNNINIDPIKLNKIIKKLFIDKKLINNKNVSALNLLFSKAESVYMASLFFQILDVLYRFTSGDKYQFFTLLASIYKTENIHQVVHHIISTLTHAIMANVTPKQVYLNLLMCQLGGNDVEFNQVLQVTNFLSYNRIAEDDDTMQSFYWLEHIFRESKKNMDIDSHLALLSKLNKILGPKNEILLAIAQGCKTDAQLTTFLYVLENNIEITEEIAQLILSDTTPAEESDDQTKQILPIGLELVKLKNNNLLNHGNIRLALALDGQISLDPNEHWIAKNKLRQDFGYALILGMNEFTKANLEFPIDEFILALHSQTNVNWKINGKKIIDDLVLVLQSEYSIHFAKELRNFHPQLIDLAASLADLLRANVKIEKDTINALRAIFHDKPDSFKNVIKACIKLYRRGLLDLYFPFLMRNIEYIHEMADMFVILDRAEIRLEAEMIKAFVKIRCEVNINHTNFIHAIISLKALGLYEAKNIRLLTNHPLHYHMTTYMLILLNHADISITKYRYLCVGRNLSDRFISEVSLLASNDQLTEKALEDLHDKFKLINLSDVETSMFMPERLPIAGSDHEPIPFLMEKSSFK